ncbi:MAG: hypothetical protein WC784_06160 [Candidatus Shapirobacteria bacterium]|jgi:hypothetical protein
MSKLKSILFYYNLAFTFILLLIGLITKVIFKSPFLLIIFIPLIVYFWGYLIFNSKKVKTPQNQSFWIFVSLLLIYNFLATTILSLSTLIFSKTLPGIIVAFLYFPYPIYFFLTTSHWFKKLKVTHPLTPSPVSTSTTNSATIDPRRRQFLKMLGGTSLSLIFLSLLNPKQAGAAFFGSVPGPGTVSLKDATGTKINPAEKQATDGYKISKIDDTSSNTYAYYGFVNQSGEWYIQQETISGVNVGNFQYYKGATNFSSNWASRSSFVYDDFEDIF